MSPQKGRFYCRRESSWRKGVMTCVKYFNGCHLKEEIDELFFSVDGELQETNFQYEESYKIRAVWAVESEKMMPCQVVSSCFYTSSKKGIFVVGIFVLRECWTNLNLEQTSVVQHSVYKMYVFMLYCQDKLVIKIWRIYLGFIMVLHTHTHTHIDFSKSQFNFFLTQDKFFI